MPDNHSVDAYSPKGGAGRVREFCIVKARLPLLSIAMLGMLAGAFIGLGARHRIGLALTCFNASSGHCPDTNNVCLRPAR